MNFIIPTAKHLSKILYKAQETAYQQDMEKLDQYVSELLGQFSNHLKMLMKDPDAFTQKNIFVKSIGSEVYALRFGSKSGVDEFIGAVEAKLRPLGYIVGRSNALGAPRDAILVSWELTKSTDEEPAKINNEELTKSNDDGSPPPWITGR